ncbi:MAG: type II toxin-antitoxin system RelE/ParE family toxin [Nevskia sp.]|nr:type II toxin-antitoxin system RelE/ParE family toxin [Nevskia sp.]
MRVEVRGRAEADLLDILDFIAKDNPARAVTYVRELRRRFEVLAKHPSLGHEGRVAGTRELVLAPYVVVYAVDDAACLVSIVRVLHGSRKYPA